MEEVLHVVCWWRRLHRIGPGHRRLWKTASSHGLILVTLRMSLEYVLLFWELIGPGTQSVTLSSHRVMGVSAERIRHSRYYQITVGSNASSLQSLHAWRQPFKLRNLCIKPGPHMRKRLKGWLLRSILLIDVSVKLFFHWHRKSLLLFLLRRHQSFYCHNGLDWLLLTWGRCKGRGEKKRSLLRV